MKSLTLIALLVVAANAPKVAARTGISDSLPLPSPSASSNALDDRVYKCAEEEGIESCVDVTPPDEKTLWRLPFGSAAPQPMGDGSYLPVIDWPFRAIISTGNAALPNQEYFYVFDRAGRIVDSNLPGAVGERMMEVRISGVRLWPTAFVYYRMPSHLGKGHGNTSTVGPEDRIRNPADYALIVDGSMLCPAADESEYRNWPGDGASPAPTGTYLNGHCRSAFRNRQHLPSSDGRDRYIHPGPRTSGLEMEWNFQRHEEPVRPLLDQKGNCVALCTQMSQASPY